MISSLELEANMIELDEHIAKDQLALDAMPHSGLTFLPSGEAVFACNNIEDRWLMNSCHDQLKEQREHLTAEWLTARAAEEEAQRRGCTPEEIIALWEDRCTYIPDYDDHSSDDCRAEQNILCEVGMHIEVNPIPLNKLDRNEAW